MSTDSGSSPRCHSRASSPWWARTTSRRRHAGGRLGRHGRRARRPTGSVELDEPASVADQEPGPAAVGEPPWTAATTSEVDCPIDRARSVTRKPSPAAASAASRARSGHDAMDGVHPQATGPHRGDQREHRIAARPGGGSGAVGPGGGEAVVAVGDDRTGSPKGRGDAPTAAAGSVTRHSRCPTPSESCSSSVGLARGGRGRRARRRSASGSWASTIGSRSVRGRRQQRAAALDRAGIGVLVRQHRRRPRRRKGDRAEPPDGRGRAAGRLQFVEPQRRAVIPLENPVLQPAGEHARRPRARPASVPAGAAPAARRGRMRRTMLFGSASASRSRPAGVTRS